MVSDSAPRPWPRQVPGPRPGLVYRLRTDLHAVHDPGARGPAPGAVLSLQRGRIQVRSGPPPPEAGSGQPEIGPVYTDPGGELVVPTGLVFVRWRKGVAAESRRDALAAAGWEIAQVPAWAPHSAWVSARQGGIGAALRRHAELRALPDVEHVEPQVVMEAARR